MAFNTQIILSDSIIVFDAIISVNPKYPNRVTEHPIEEGASIADHIILDNVLLDLEGIVTSSASLFGSALSSTTPKEAHQNLLRAREKREVAQVITSLRTYDNMAIKSFAFPRDNETGDALKIIINFEQITLASSSFVQEAPVAFSNDIADDAADTETTGAQSTSLITDSTLDDVSSSLNDIVFGGGR